MSESISVVIPAYNAGSQLVQSVEAVLAQDIDTPIEVVIVDDGSTDGCADRAAESFPSAVVVRTERLGCDGARQAGMDAAGGGIVANTDADCVVSPTWLRSIVDGLSGGASAVTGPVIHQPDLLTTLVAVTDFGEFQRLRGGQTRNFPGCNFGIRVESLASCGYHIRKDLSCGADRLLSWRLSAQGKILYDPQAAVYHYPNVKAGELLSRRRRYALTAMAMRVYDPSLPGGWLSKLGRLAAPAYCAARFGRDMRATAEMAADRRVSPVRIPAVVAGSLVLRLADLTFMLCAKPGETVDYYQKQPGSR